ncbi:VMAP-C domain-containing protein [Streptomyces mirabilis]|uniref:VMAP-C domain-containing protein n=1 Tax=Streptomyces mirabilis TaxID=68239 RepID=UPI0036550928
MGRWRRLPGRRTREHNAHHRAPRSRPPWHAERVLTKILLGIDWLHQSEHRADLLTAADPRLRDVTPERSRARDHLRAMVRVARHTGRLPSLRDALLSFQPDEHAAVLFDLAVTALTMPGALPTADMFDLIDELREFPPEFGAMTVSAYKSERRAYDRPLDAASLSRALLQLYDARVDPADPAAPRRNLMLFLRLLAEEPVPPGLGDALPRLTGRLVDRHGGTSGRTDPAGAHVYGGTSAPDGTASTEPMVIIQIRVDEAGAPSDLPYTRQLYSLRGLIYEYVGGGEPVLKGPAKHLPGLITGAELEHRGRDFLIALHGADEVRRGARRRVEFLLPDSLLGHPFELWPSGPAEVPVGRGCQVVVRSVIRYRDRSVHEAWIDRWNRLDQDCSPGDAIERIGWLNPDNSAARPRGENRILSPPSWRSSTVI